MGLGLSEGLYTLLIRLHCGLLEFPSADFVGEENIELIERPVLIRVSYTKNRPVIYSPSSLAIGSIPR